MNLQACLEALLFMSSEPLSLPQIQAILLEQGLCNSEEQIINLLKTLQLRYEALDSGIQLVEIAQGYQLRTKLDYAPLLQKLGKIQVNRLSIGALETLAVIAYHQPVLKDRIDQIRGVDSGHFLRILMNKKLIEIHGRSELPGKPILYSTTNEFLKVFSLAALADLPALPEIQNMIPASEISPEQEIRKIIQDSPFFDLAAELLETSPESTAPESESS